MGSAAAERYPLDVNNSSGVRVVMPRQATIRCAVLFLSIVAPATSCLDLGACTNEVLSVVASPGGGERAVVFWRNCGATTGKNTQVSVLAIGVPLPDSGGNVFRADTDHGRAPAGAHGGPQVTIRWLAIDTLEVRYDDRVRIFAQHPRTARVTVRFVGDSAGVR